VVIKVLVASASVLKVRAVHEEFEAVMEGASQIQCIPIKASSGINEQPVGFEETLAGAMNRMADAKQKNEEEDIGFVVGIESGIYVINGKCFDFGWVIIERCLDGKMVSSTTPFIEFPAEEMEEANRRGFETTTVGDIFAERNPEANTKDPHSFLTQGKTSRGKLLAQGISAALAQLI